MKTIKQAEENDCGVACVAMLAGVSYEEARRVIYPNGRSRLTKTKDLRVALEKLGRKPLSVRRQPFRSQTLLDLKTDALVFVEMGNDNDSKHWIVWDATARKVRDPYPKRHSHRLRGFLSVE